MRRSGRQGIPRCRVDIEGGEAFVAITQDEDEPRNVTEALSGPDKENWTNAMEDEMESMRSNQVWELVDLPKGRKCDAPNPGCPLTTRQPAEILYVSCYETYT